MITSGGVMKTQLYSWIVLALFASTALPQGNALVQRNTPTQRTAQTRLPVIDVHMHAYAKDERWNQKIPNPATGRPMTATNEQAHMREDVRRDEEIQHREGNCE